MKQIRFGVFETNSSSIHSLVVCTKDEYEKFKNGELLIDVYHNCIIKNEFTDEEIRDMIEDYNCDKQEFWKDWEDLTDDEKNKWFSGYSDNSRHGKYSYKDIYKFDVIDNGINCNGKSMVAISIYGSDY